MKREYWLCTAFCSQFSFQCFSKVFEKNFKVQDYSGRGGWLRILNLLGECAPSMIGNKKSQVCCPSYEQISSLVKSLVSAQYKN